MRLIKYMSMVLLAAITMGAGGCDNPPSIAGDWNADCTYTNPPSKHKYFWTFDVDDESGVPPGFTEYEVINGNVEFWASNYIYQQGVLTITNPTGDSRLFVVTANTGSDNLSLTGGEYKCVLTKATTPHP